MILGVYFNNRNFKRLIKGSLDFKMSSLAKSAAKEGIKVGLIRPITLWPFPEKEFQKYAEVPKAFLSVELSAGQMVEDVRLAVNGKRPVYFHGRTGGMVPTQQEILDKIKEIVKGGQYGYSI
jgi:2-oxoglutarate ferredoxin oxidoreductase subunit alpha